MCSDHAIIYGFFMHSLRTVDSTKSGIAAFVAQASRLSDHEAPLCKVSKDYTVRIFFLMLLFNVGSCSAFAQNDGSVANSYESHRIGGYEATAPASGYSDSQYTLFANAPGATLAADAPAQTDGAGGPPPSGASAAPKRGFFTRLGHAYLDDWTVDSNGSPAAPEPARRGTPRPLNSPPFPAADWPMGGTVVIGAPDYSTYPLMQAINENKTRFKMYGWFDFGGNASTSNKGRYANNETAYDIIPNSIQLNQVALYFERLPNTVQTDHIDWGFRFTSLYGLDYRYTTAKGIFSQQLLRSNNQYGYDPVMYYLDFYVPHVAQGMDVRIGRYISLPDIEAQLAPNNYTYSHSILYTYDCYTQNGINTTTKLNDHWTVQAGVSGGCESAPWISNAKLTGNVCAAYTWHDGGDNLYACANSINSGKYAYNNLCCLLSDPLSQNQRDMAYGYGSVVPVRERCP